MRRGGGALAGAGLFSVGAGNTLINNGIIRPGGASTIGALSLTGNLQQGSGGSLATDLAGTTVGTQYDLFAVSGSADLNGTFSLKEQSGFKAGFADSFVPLTYGSRVGS